MTMVVNKFQPHHLGYKNCQTCGEKMNRSSVWVRVDFPRKNISEDSGLTVNSYVIEFCSLKCFRNFDWTKLHTEEDWLQGHTGKHD